MTYHRYILVLFIAFNFTLFAQETNIEFGADLNLLNDLGQQIISSKTDEQRITANKEYASILKSVINKEGSFDYDFKALKTISVLQAHNLKIYNWVLPATDGTFKYFAFLQIKTAKTEFDVIELTDKSKNMKSPENKILTARSWYGALYYKLIHNKKIGKNYYTLLGWDGNNNLTNKKIIDVINISSTGMVKFGAPIFKTKKKTKKRMVFEYSENVVMSLKYHHEIEKIVYDVLIPASSKLKVILRLRASLYLERS